MGVVWKARDTTLDRDVAIKFLPEAFATDEDRMARFEREAKLLASLHHPNIASIFGFETVGDCTFLVMELVEGEDLAALLRNGALSVDEAMPRIAHSPFSPLQCSGVLGAELPAPVADALLGDGDSTLRQEILDVSEAHAEPVIQPDGVADNLGWEPVAAVAGSHAVHLATLPPGSS